MNKQIALLGAIQILSALSCGLFILILTLSIIKYYGKKWVQIDQKNTSFNIVIGAILFAIGYVMSGVIEPILSSFRLLAEQNISNLELISSFLLTGGLYIAIGYLSSIVVISSGLFTYSFITKISEKEEIQNNNIGIAIVLASIIITLTLMTQSGIILLIESLVPYPEIAPR